DPDVDGRAHWVDALRQGASRDSVVDGFLFSTEAIHRLVESYYEAILDRSAEPLGLAHWTSVLQNHLQNPTQVATQFLSSKENLLQGPTNDEVTNTQEDAVPLVPMPTKDNKDQFFVKIGDTNNVVFNSPIIRDANRTVPITNNDPTKTIFPFFRAAN